MKELKGLARIDDDDLVDFIELHALGKGDEEDSELNQDWLDLDSNNVIANFEMIGKTFWDESQNIRDKVRDLAAQLIIKFVEGTFGATHALPTYVSRPIKKDSEFFELDIDATLEAQIDHPGQKVQPWTFQRRTARNPVVLLVDTSLSMNGEKLLIAGITVATLARLIPSSDLVIIGFAKNVYFIKQFHEELSPYHLVSRIFKLVPKGPTNLAEAINKGAELIFPFNKIGRLILLSDAEPTFGKNPIPEASKLPTLDLLLFPGGNAWLAKKLVLEVVEGKLYVLDRIEDVPNALQKMFKN